MMILHGAAGPAGLAVNVVSSSSLLSSWGALGLFAIVFAETGLLIGFFLPGDSLLARFIPVVRTVANPLAGTLGVPAATFTLWQAAGGLVWSLGITLAGYALGSTIPGVDQYLLPAIAVIVVLSLLPILIELRRNRRDAPAGRHAARSAEADDQQEPSNGEAPSRPVTRILARHDRAAAGSRKPARQDRPMTARA